MTRHFVVTDKASLFDIRHSMRGDLGRAGASEQISFDCVVAVTEACTNALEYGMSDEEGARAPELRWEIDPSIATFHVQDHSSRRWSMATHPSKGEDLLRDRGRGFEMMRGLMDEVDVQSLDGGTVVRLRKRL